METGSRPGSRLEAPEVPAQGQPQGRAGASGRRLALSAAVPTLVLGALSAITLLVIAQRIGQRRSSSDQAQALGDLVSTARTAAFIIVGLTLLALLALFGLTRLIDRRLTAPIFSLTQEARRLARDELPRLANDPNAALGRGNPVDPEAIEELAELGQAIDEIHLRSAELLSEGTASPGQITDVLLNLGRRNQQLIGRQLRFLEDLERSETDPELLEQLFTLDQLATRMRRNADSLVVLAGEDLPRRAEGARTIEDVVRGAMSEVEDFVRVEVDLLRAHRVKPFVASDLTHLVAELLENALNFSPPSSPVEVSASEDSPYGYVLSISDEGVGMPPDRLAEVNATLADPRLPAEASTSTLGLLVAGHLAARHGVNVELRNDLPGTTALITIPLDCIIPLPQSSGPLGARARSGELASAYEPDDSELAGFRPPSIEMPVVGVLPGGTSQSDTNAAPTAVDADEVEAPAPTGPGRFVGEDEQSGTPIPPFRARESKLPATNTNNGERSNNGTGSDSGDPEMEQFRVRRRTRQRPPSIVVSDSDGKPAAAKSGKARADEVKEKLTKFADGILAAKAGNEDPDDPNTGINKGTGS